MQTPRFPSWALAAVVAVSCILPIPVFAAERIKDFSVTATLSADRNFEVEEAITYDFDDAERHGIYRYIPVVTIRNGSTYRYRLDVESVTRDGNEEPYDVSNEGSAITIKIGDADRTITGSHVYRIRYRTDRAMTFFPDHSELYWNVTGNGWEVPIGQASFSLTIPSSVNLASVSSTCFTGAFGSRERECSFSQTTSQSTVTTRRPLLNEEGLTVAFAFPRGVIQEPTFSERIQMVLVDNGVLFFPIAAFIIMFLVWWKKGKDPKRRTVVPEYEAPRGLLPAVMAAASTEDGVSNRAVTATMISLARRGYMTIRFGEKKGLLGSSTTFTFVEQKKADGSVTPAERVLLSGLFESKSETTIDELKAEKFYIDVAAFKRLIQADLNALKVFVANPTNVRGAYFIVGFIVGWILLVAFQSSALETASAIATGFIVAVFGWFMPRRTDDGIRLLAEIEGFKWFLSVTEKDRLAFTDAPERTPEQFQAFLPYAIVFGVEKKWAAQFESMQIPPPNWASGNLAAMGAGGLASSMSQLNSAASQSAFASPSGGSGGSSGGGGGGGGGGSW